MLLTNHEFKKVAKNYMVIILLLFRVGEEFKKNIFNLYCVHEQNKSAAKNEQYHQINHTFVQLCDLLGKNLHEHAKLKEFSVIKFCNLFFRGYLTFKQK